MAVIRHSIIFGGVDSADYGIYIGGEGVFNAPQRDVEMIEIPGRNGAFALDRGRFKNIEVTYTAINHEPDLATFSANLEAFRNALASQKGYQRLTDTFHPDEYRMAAFVNGLEIEPIEYNTAAEFEVTFDCKPQRFLTSGEAAVTVSSGDAITNPTLFDAPPLLEIEGYGIVSFNGYEIDNAAIPFGEYDLTYTYNRSGNSPRIETLTLTNTSLLNAGDRIKLVCSGISTIHRIPWASSEVILGSVTQAKVSSSQGTGINPSIFYDDVGGYISYFGTKKTGLTHTFNYGTSSSATYTVTYSIETTNTTYASFSPQDQITLSYDAAQNIITITVAGVGWQKWNELTDYSADRNLRPTVTGFSTTPTTGYTTIVDCDLGEAYKIVDGELISMNRYINLGSQLPTLAAGSNTIEYDNTITLLKITPRWWKV